MKSRENQIWLLLKEAVKFTSFIFGFYYKCDNFIAWKCFSKYMVAALH